MQIITDANFAAETANGMVLVDFFADWCGPCKMLIPILEQVEPEYSGKIKFVKINVDESPEAAGRYSVVSIPTLILMKDGQEVTRITGFQSKDALMQKFNEFIG